MLKKPIIFALLLMASCGHDPSSVKVVDMGLKGASVGVATVEKNDTLSEVAVRYNLSMDSIIAANNLKSPYTIHPNQRLILPPPKTYTVRKGDTIYEISRLFSTTQTAIVRKNNIQKPYYIRAGQVLKMPMPQQRFSSVAKTTAKETPEIRAVKKKAKISAPKLSGNGQFEVPVKGRIVSEFGPKDGGLHNDGINIVAPIGQPVGASQAGVVAYVGNAIEGYGNLVLVRHDKGYITAYAHLDSIDVKRGDLLGRGQILGKIGQTGSVKEPQLHFEIRKGTKALNPSLYL